MNIKKTKIALLFWNFPSEPTEDGMSWTVSVRPSNQEVTLYGSNANGTSRCHVVFDSETTIDNIERFMKMVGFTEEVK